ncbi:hypothetical protein AHOG_04380 [Actinoalloteichus hoggarensis]|uniref:Uncharacterized protein n=1 Tax=Actinoalloteichus hoggarensis TaxID=1470176 RepID=A0A221VY99_9PSEU|nr:hypothetical protein AHOG_04380 [Actinoalloteichus hoggarensis]
MLGPRPDPSIRGRSRDHTTIARPPSSQLRAIRSRPARRARPDRRVHRLRRGIASGKGADTRSRRGIRQRAAIAVDQTSSHGTTGSTIRRSTVWCSVVEPCSIPTSARNGILFAFSGRRHAASRWPAESLGADSCHGISVTSRPGPGVPRPRPRDARRTTDHDHADRGSHVAAASAVHREPDAGSRYPAAGGGARGRPSVPRAGRQALPAWPMPIESGVAKARLDRPRSRRSISARGTSAPAWPRRRPRPRGDRRSALPRPESVPRWPVPRSTRSTRRPGATP